MIFFDFKKICPHLGTIYIFPKDIEMAKEMTRRRHLAPNVENARLAEIDQHFQRITTDDNLRDMFDYVLYNNYDNESKDILIRLVRKLMSEEKWKNRGMK